MFLVFFPQLLGTVFNNAQIPRRSCLSIFREDNMTFCLRVVGHPKYFTSYIIVFLLYKIKVIKRRMFPYWFTTVENSSYQHIILVAHATQKNQDNNKFMNLTYNYSLCCICLHFLKLTRGTPGDVSWHFSLKDKVEQPLNHDGSLLMMARVR